MAGGLSGSPGWLRPPRPLSLAAWCRISSGEPSAMTTVPLFLAEVLLSSYYEYVA